MKFSIFVFCLLWTYAIFLPFGKTFPEKKLDEKGLLRISRESPSVAPNVCEFDEDELNELVDYVKNLYNYVKNLDDFSKNKKEVDKSCGQIHEIENSLIDLRELLENLTLNSTTANEYEDLKILYENKMKIVRKKFDEIHLSQHQTSSLKIDDLSSRLQQTFAEMNKLLEANKIEREQFRETTIALCFYKIKEGKITDGIRLLEMFDGSETAAVVIDKSYDVENLDRLLKFARKLLTSKRIIAAFERIHANIKINHDFDSPYVLELKYLVTNIIDSERFLLVDGAVKLKYYQLNHRLDSIQQTVLKSMSKIFNEDNCSKIKNFSQNCNESYEFFVEQIFEKSFARSKIADTLRCISTFTSEKNKLLSFRALLKLMKFQELMGSGEMALFKKNIEEVMRNGYKHQNLLKLM